MSVAVDANLLLYASDRTSERHDRARAVLERLAAGPDLVYLFWPVTMAYLRIATHPAVFEHPLEPRVARGNVASLLARPHVRRPGEQRGFWRAFTATVGSDVIRGNLVTDAHIASLMRQHGVQTILTVDRDFQRFEAITARDPFEDGTGI